MSELFDFTPLREYLERQGIQVGEPNIYTPVTPDDVVFAGAGAVYFTGDDGSNGIFFKDKKGVEHQVFMYKRDYHLERYGKPRIHLCQCDTINDFISRGSFEQHYRYANTDEVPVIDMDNDDEEVMIDDLPLCKQCRKLLNNPALSPDSTSFDFVEILKAAGDASNHPSQQIQDVDMFGYVKDWEKISKAYRQKQNFTCENCGYHAPSEMSKRFLQVHHKDGDKLNNHESNLQCLCICCHANVDDTHLHNFAYPSNYAQLEEFLCTAPVISQLSNQINTGTFNVQSIKKSNEEQYVSISYKNEQGEEIKFPLVVPFCTPLNIKFRDIINDNDIYLVALDEDLKHRYAFIKKTTRKIQTTNDIFPTIEEPDEEYTSLFDLPF